METKPGTEVSLAVPPSHQIAIPASLHVAAPRPAAATQLAIRNVPRLPPGQPTVGGLSEMLQLLGRHKVRLLAGACVGLVVGLLFGLSSPKLYRARVALQIQNPNGDFLNARAVNSVAETSVADAGSLTDVATEIKIMESDELLDRVVAKLEGTGEAGPLEVLALQRSIPARLLRRPLPTGEVRLARMREKARGELAVKQVGPTRAVEILYSAPDSKFAALFANSLAQQYIDRSEEARWSKSRRTEESLSHELDEVKARLTTSQDALQKYAVDSGLLFVGGSPSSLAPEDISAGRLIQLQAGLSQAEADRMVAQSHYEIAKGADTESVSDVLNDQRLRELKEKLTDLRRQRAELEATYTDEDDRVRQIVAQITPLQQEFKQQLNSILNRIGKDYRTALLRESLLQVAFGAQVRVVEGKESESVRYNMLKQEVDSSQKLYESVLEQVRRAGIASTVRSNNIEIFDPARPPVDAYSPRPLLLSALGAICGLIVISGFTLLTNSTEHRLEVAGELPERLHLPELGVIPQSARSRSAMLRSKALRAKVETITRAKNRNVTSEAYRALLTSILYSDEDGRSPRVIVLTSVNPGEGKTTAASNLGIMMAELNKRVLLIDADLRRPRLHQLFEKAIQPGLADLLGHEAKSDLKASIHATAVPNLSLLTSGTTVKNSTSLLHSSRFPAVLQQLRDEFDVILIDTPPSQPVADARIVGRSADGVVLVTRAGVTTVGEVEQMARILAADGTRLLGTVLNGVKMRRSAYNYYAASA